MIRVSIEPIAAEAFAPFGQLLPPAPDGARRELIDELQNARAGARPRFSIATVAPAVLPFTATRMERHVHSSQAFAPLDCASYLVVVAPHAPDGKPDLARVRAFRVPADTGLNYKADTWHHPLTALEGGGRFAVLTFVDGSAADQEFVDLAEPVVIVE